MERDNNYLTSEKLELETEKVLKMLQKKEMPYKWQHLQDDIIYNFIPRNQILGHLYELGYIEDFDLNSFVLTKKGRKFKSLRRENLKKWYRDLPENNWLLSDIIKHVSSSIIGAILGGLLALQLFHQCNRQSLSKETKQKTEDTLRVVK